MNREAVRQLLEPVLRSEHASWEAGDAHRLSVRLGPDEVRPAASVLREKAKARFVTLTAMDTGLEIELIYLFAVGALVVALRTAIPKDAASLSSIVDVVPGAEIIEREVAELFGVVFAGHPRNENQFLPEEWDPSARPLRKPLAGSVLPQARLSLENVLRDGASLRVSPPMLARRESAGLPKRPPLVGGSPETVQGFQAMVRKCGFDRRAGYDWTTGRLKAK